MPRTRSRPSAAALARRAERKSANRREFVLAARRFFSREGIYDSRVEDITRQAGLAKGTLYLYFRSKEELLAAVVHDAFDELEAFVRTRLDQDPGPPAAALFQAHVEFFAGHPDVLRILHQVRGALKFDRKRWSRLRACLRLHLEFCETCLARGDGRSTPARRRELAVFLFGCASGAASVQVSANPEAPALSRRASQWSHWIAGGLQETARRGRGAQSGRAAQAPARARTRSL